MWPGIQQTFLFFDRMFILSNSFVASGLVALKNFLVMLILTKNLRR